MNRDKMS